MFLKKCPGNCPLCGLPDSLYHIVLRCASLNLIRQQIKRDVNLPFLRGKSFPLALPAGATPQICEYIRQYISRAFNDEHSGSSPDTHAVALWIARSQIDTLQSLDRPFTSARLSVAEARYLQKTLVSVSSKLLAGASRMWQNRCRQYTTPVSSYATMTSNRLTPGSVQPSIYSAFSALRAASNTLSTVRDTDTSGNHVQSELHNSPGPPLLSLDFPFHLPVQPAVAPRLTNSLCLLALMGRINTTINRTNPY
jgi:hypothetical protein